MWSIADVSAEELAKLFHHYQGALADHQAGRHGEEDLSWERTPQQEKKLMVAAARLALMELATAHPAPSNRKYFAKPGEADWGC